MTLGRPQYIQFYPTTRCNQRCSFCFNPEQPVPRDMSYANALKLLDIMSSNGIGEIDIMGGEPLLLEWMPDFMVLAAAGGMSVNISTNGSVRQMIPRLKGLDPRKVTIGISLEGSTAEQHNLPTDSVHFNTAVASIRELVSYGLDPVVKTVVTGSACDDLQHLVDLLADMGVKRYCLIHMDLLTHSAPLQREVLSYLDFLHIFQSLAASNPDIGIFKVHASCFDRSCLPEGVRCAGGVRKVAVMPDGTVLPCNLFQGVKGFEIGNILVEGFTDIWTDHRLDYFRQYSENRCDLRDCANRSSCTGGCPAHGLFHFHDPDRADVRCKSLLRKTRAL